MHGLASFPGSTTHQKHGFFQSAKKRWVVEPGNEASMDEFSNYLCMQVFQSRSMPMGKYKTVSLLPVRY